MTSTVFAASLALAATSAFVAWSGAPVRDVPEQAASSIRMHAKNIAVAVLHPIPLSVAQVVMRTGR